MCTVKSLLCAHDAVSVFVCSMCVPWVHLLKRQGGHPVCVQVCNFHVCAARRSPALHCKLSGLHCFGHGLPSASHQVSCVFSTALLEVDGPKYSVRGTVVCVVQHRAFRPCAGAWHLVQCIWQAPSFKACGCNCCMHSRTLV